MKVKATSTGYYNHMLRIPGSPKGLDVFDIQNEKEFAWEWMEPIGWTPKTPRPGDLDDSVTGEKKSAVQQINEKTDAMLANETKVVPAVVYTPTGATVPAPPAAAPAPIAPVVVPPPVVAAPAAVPAVAPAQVVVTSQKPL